MIKYIVLMFLINSSKIRSISMNCCSWLTEWKRSFDKSFVNWINRKTFPISSGRNPNTESEKGIVFFHLKFDMRWNFFRLDKARCLSVKTENSKQYDL